MLEDILELLDLPRQAAVNVGRGLFDSENAVGALPGLLGMLGTAGLAATGFGLPLALLGGSAIGGAGQLAGNMTGRREFVAPTTGEIANSWFGDDGFLPSLVAGAVTDPLTYVGGIGGARAGARAGRGLESAAVAAGPGYKGQSALAEAIKAADLAIDGRTGWGSHFTKKFEQLTPDQVNRVAGEIPEGSTFLGNGMDALAFRTPQGDVLRVGAIFDQVGQGRPIAESMLPATRTVDLPLTGLETKGVRVERSPLAEMKPDSYWERLQLRPGMTAREKRMAQTPMESVADAARRDGMEFWDNHGGNVALYRDKPVIIDPGAVSAGAEVPRFPAIVASDRQSPLLRLLGSQGRVRRQLETGAPLGLDDLMRQVGTGVGMGAPALARPVYTDPGPF